MALNDAALIQNIVDLQDEMMQATDYEASKLIYAQKLVLAFKTYLLSGTVNVTVTTTGTATAHTGTGTGTIS